MAGVGATTTIPNLQTIQDIEDYKNNDGFAQADDIQDEINNIPLDSINQDIEAEERERLAAQNP